MFEHDNTRLDADPCGRGEGGDRALLLVAAGGARAAHRRVMAY